MPEISKSSEIKYQSLAARPAAHRAIKLAAAGAGITMLDLMDGLAKYAAEVAKKIKQDEKP